MEWQKWEPDARDILIDRVRRGKLSPDEAEAEAAKQGFGPLATVPDQLEFDPERMPWWSLPMALAWIAWRNIASVREHCAEYCEKRLLWRALGTFQARVEVNLSVLMGTDSNHWGNQRRAAYRLSRTICVPPEPCPQQPK
jgi:hypothetical protein